MRAAELADDVRGGGGGEEPVHYSLAIKQHTQLASRVYTAIACVLYATLGWIQAGETEAFIKKRCTQLPAQLIDMHEWGQVLTFAKQAREQGGSVIMEKNKAKMTKMRRHAFGEAMALVEPVAAEYRRLQSKTQDDVIRLRLEMKQDSEAVNAAVGKLAAALTEARAETQQGRLVPPLWAAGPRLWRIDTNACSPLPRARRLVRGVVGKPRLRRWTRLRQEGG
jgi:hypothetical protein